MNYTLAYDFVMAKLRVELSPSLGYHSIHHTEEVIESAIYLAKAENVTDVKELTILKTAALFHDIGYVESWKNHEETSCDYARDLLPQFDYTSEEIDRICKMIMTTKVPQTAYDNLSAILCDADLYYLGGNDYFEKADLLHKEMTHANFMSSDVNWKKEQVKFLEAHKFHTNTARQECDNQKTKTMKAIKEQMSIDTINNRKTFILDLLLIIIGASIAAVALKGFFVPNHYFDGGITGLSLLTHELTQFSLAIILFLFNLPFIIVGYYTVSKEYALKTTIACATLGIILTLVPNLNYTHDKLLVSIFGGIILGLGVGIVMRAGAALDGLEVLALYTLKKTSFTMTEIILGINFCIFTVAGFKFGIETAMYSMLTYFCATQTIDYVIEGIQAYLGVTIVSSHSEEVKVLLVEELGRGITVYKGERGFLPGQFDKFSSCDIIFTVITRLELRKMRNLIHELDPKAFVFVYSIKESAGGVLKNIKRH